MRFFPIAMVVLIGLACSVSSASLDEHAWKRALMIPAEVIRSVIQNVKPHYFEFYDSGVTLRSLPPDAAYAYLCYHRVVHNTLISNNDAYLRLLSRQLYGWKDLAAFESAGLSHRYAQVCQILASTDIFAHVPDFCFRAASSAMLKALLFLPSSPPAVSLFLLLSIAGRRYIA